MTGMCPHCGADVTLEHGLTLPHWTVDDAGDSQQCPGGQQNARNAESDARPLWNGKPNTRFAG